MNNSYNPFLEENFNTAMNLSEAQYDYSTLIALLNSEKIVEKQIAALSLREIKSKEDAKLLVSKLVNQDGKVREAVAFKVRELILNKEFSNLFLEQENYEIFMLAIMDINPNVCRQILDIAAYLKNDTDFKIFCTEELLLKIDQTFFELEKFSEKDKKFVINKELFRLYWELEVLFEYVEFIDSAKLKPILIKAGEISDYQIREKVAKILTMKGFSIDEELEQLKNKLKNDENYYVRRYFD